MKKIKVMALCAAMAVMMAMPVKAALPEMITVPKNYTGWNTEGTQAVYYMNGAKAANVWVLNGRTLYYLGADGYMVPNAVFDVDAAASAGITNYINTNNANLQYAAPMLQSEEKYSAVKMYYKVNDDFDAFKVLYPEKVAAFGTDAAGLYNNYISSYMGKTPDDAYMRALDGFLNSYYYNVHDYTFHYETNEDGTHKAYCGCGQYIIEECDKKEEASMRRNTHRCSKCGQHFKHTKNDR